MSTKPTETQTPKAIQSTDKGRFEKHIKPVPGGKEPHEIIRLDVDRLRVSLSKKLKPQTVQHVLGLLKRIIRFGAKRQLCRELPFPYRRRQGGQLHDRGLDAGSVKKPPESHSRINRHRGGKHHAHGLVYRHEARELFKLQWADVDFDRGFITIR